MSLGVCELWINFMSTALLVSYHQRVIDITGVMPTPPENNALSVGKSMQLKLPMGPCCHFVINTQVVEAS